MPKPTVGHVGFDITCGVRPGLTIAQLRGVERAFEDRAEAHQLVLEGHQLSYCISALDRDLTLVDQVDVLDWALDFQEVAKIEVRMLSATPGRPTQQVTASVTAYAADPARQALSLLYRSRRITPSCYISAIGGFTRPVG